MSCRSGNDVPGSSVNATPLYPTLSGLVGVRFGSIFGFKINVKAPEAWEGLDRRNMPAPHMFVINTNDDIP